MALKTLHSCSKFIEITSILFNQESFADIKFIFLRRDSNAIETIYGHSTVLLVRCPKLYALCYDKLVGSCTVLMEKSTHKNFLEFIKFIYTDKCTVNFDNFKELLLLARAHNLLGLVEFCWEVLENFTVQNCLDILQFTATHDFEKIKLKVLDWISWNFSAVIKSNEFLIVEKAVVAEVIKLD